MRYDPVFLAFTVTSPSPEESRRIQEKLRQEIGPDSQLVDTRVSSEGTEKIFYRLGDFFTEILVLPETEGNPKQFRLVFHRHPHAGHFWKDIMVRIVHSLESADPKVTVSMDYKGDDPLDWKHLNSESKSNG